MPDITDFHRMTPIQLYRYLNQVKDDLESADDAASFNADVFDVVWIIEDWLRRHAEWGQGRNNVSK